MKHAVGALLLVACASGSPRADVTPQPLPSASVAMPPPRPLFPEEPALDALAPSRPAFAQETWTGAGDWQQHCREWGVAPSRKEEITAAVNARLADRGIEMPSKTRGKDVVVALGAFTPGLVTPREELVKFVVCTEGIAPRSAHEAFARPLLRDRNAPLHDLGEPDVAWERVHATGEVEMGFRFPKLDAAEAQRIVAAVEHVGSPAVQVKMRGPDLWWTALRAR